MENSIYKTLPYCEECSKNGAVLKFSWHQDEHGADTELTLDGTPIQDAKAGTIVQELSSQLCNSLSRGPSAFVRSVLEL